MVVVAEAVRSSSSCGDSVVAEALAMLEVAVVVLVAAAATAAAVEVIVVAAVRTSHLMDTTIFHITDKTFHIEIYNYPSPTHFTQTSLQHTQYFIEHTGLYRGVKHFFWNHTPKK